MKNIDHIMPSPRVIPIFWGHEYAANPGLYKNLRQMILDAVTGPFMNGLAQYGIERGTMLEPIVIDDPNPPATITYTDSSGRLVDEITQQLIKWIKVELSVPPPLSADDINTLYVIIPSIRTFFNIFNGTGDPTGNGVQGFHAEDRILPSPPPHYYWLIVRTSDYSFDGAFGGDIRNAEAADGALDFVGGTGGRPFGGVYGIAKKVYHEFVEQCADRNGTFAELGDNTPIHSCNDAVVPYRGWSVQQYLSVWGKGCRNGDDPVSVKEFLNAIGFDFGKLGLRSLAAGVINVQYIARAMRDRPAPDTSGL
jgi:hypothetical protein